ncbi:MAG TPA: chemotaxis protein CheC [Acidobacteriota bacterium]|nr:chemotaxis protein CheC [Acidobacteriota bacterium]
MTSWNTELNEEQIDSLKEVGNIGAGHAASQLARLIGRKCVVGVPELCVMDSLRFDDLIRDPDAMVVALHMRVLGDIPASMLVLTRRAHAQLILDYMSPSAAPQTVYGEEAFEQALRQLAEVLTRSFADAIAQFLGVNARYSFAGALTGVNAGDLSALLFPDTENRHHLAIQANFFDIEDTFQGKLVYLLSPDSQAMILERIDELLG